MSNFSHTFLRSQSFFSCISNFFRYRAGSRNCAHRDFVPMVILLKCNFRPINCAVPTLARTKSLIAALRIIN